MARRIIVAAVTATWLTAAAWLILPLDDTTWRYTPTVTRTIDCGTGLGGDERCDESRSERRTQAALLAFAGLAGGGLAWWVIQPE